MARKSLKQTNKQTYSLPTGNYLGRIENDLKSNQSKLSMVLGTLIILVVGVLIFNYFSKSKSDLGPAQQTQQQELEQDVTPGQLPGKYTVKDGDTLFLIAEKYYSDGYKFDLIAKTNNLADANVIETDQILEIPKLTKEALAPAPSPSPELGTGGADTTVWGPKIEGDTYTVVEGDWLSTISARAYGDIFAYQKIASANNIPNPDYILPGQVLTIPR